MSSKDNTLITPLISFTILARSDHGIKERPFFLFNHLSEFSKTTMSP